MKCNSNRIGFFSITPGIILYTFTQFHSTPAIITSVLIGIGIVFCGCAMVHNVFVWQKEKTICVRNSANNPLNMTMNSQISTIQPTATMQHYQNTNGHLHMHHHHTTASPHGHHNHTPLTYLSQISRNTPVTSVTPVTPLSANHSHVSFTNHQSYLPNFAVRTATATPPTPKVNINNNNIISSRDASGSVSPGMTNTGTLDLSNITAEHSPHELSTLV